MFLIIGTSSNSHNLEFIRAQSTMNIAEYIPDITDVKAWHFRENYKDDFKAIFYLVIIPKQLHLVK